MLVQVAPPSVDLKTRLLRGPSWNATAVFIHASEVQVAGNLVAGDLHVADEGALAGRERP